MFCFVLPRKYWTLLNHDLMASREKAISVMAGNLNSGRSYLNTAVSRSSTSCQTFSIFDIPSRITVIYGPLNDLSKIYRLLWVLTKTLNIHWILEEAPQTNLLYFVTSNIRFFQQQKKIQKNFRHSFSKKCFMLNWSLFFT